MRRSQAQRQQRQVMLTPDEYANFYRTMMIHQQPQHTQHTQHTQHIQHGQQMEPQRRLKSHMHEFRFNLDNQYSCSCTGSDYTTFTRVGRPNELFRLCANCIRAIYDKGITHWLSYLGLYRALSSKLTAYNNHILNHHPTEHIFTRNNPLRWPVCGGCKLELIRTFELADELGWSIRHNNAIQGRIKLAEDRIGEIMRHAMSYRIKPLIPDARQIKTLNSDGVPIFFSNGIWNIKDKEENEASPIEVSSEEILEQEELEQIVI